MKGGKADVGIPDCVCLWYALIYPVDSVSLGSLTNTRPINDITDIEGDQRKGLKFAEKIYLETEVTLL